MYWIGRSAPSTRGGNISRKAELKEHCAYFARPTTAPNAQGNQRRPLNYDAISATLLPAVWLTQLL